MQRHRWVLALLLPAVAAGLLSACGGSSSSAATASTSTTTPATTAPASGSGPARAGFAKFESCLESHGLPADALGFGRGAGGGGFGGGGSAGSSGTTTRPTVTLPKGVTESQFEAAMKACAADRPSFGGGAFGRGFGGGFGSSAQDKAYEACLTEHGATIPTRSSTGSTPPSTTAGTQPFNNPKFQAAEKACAALRPKFTPPTSSTTVAS